MPNHNPRSSERSSLFQRSKTLPTGSHRRFTTPVIPTFRYDSVPNFSSDLRRDVHDNSNFSVGNRTAVLKSDEKPEEATPSQVLSTHSPSQRITRLWTHFSLTHCVCYIFWLLPSSIMTESLTKVLVFMVVSINSDL